MKKQNPIAKELRTPQFKKRIVEDKRKKIEKDFHTKMLEERTPLPCPMHEDYDEQT